ncbi:hypothetical protein BDF14DRAFT_1861078 [Spinellus fusiger]|nr:hypothetical protein BDF14DRAFT_1861078 [Spinellus fusiger]
MKFSILISAVLGLTVASSSVKALNIRRDTYELPPIISDRVRPPTYTPSANLDAEASAIASNPPLPSDIPQKGGYALNATGYPSDYRSTTATATATITSFSVPTSL